MANQPVTRTTYGGPPPDTDVFVPSRSQSEKLAITTASREATQREAAYLAALNRASAPAPVLPRLREPELSQEHLNALDRDLLARGVAFDKGKLLALGQKRFQELLAKDSAARAMQRVIGTRTDLSDWASTASAFASVNGLTTPVPRRKLSEQATGTGIERERASEVVCFADLWKVTQNQEIVRSVYSFHDAFASLCFGQSMLERLQDDGRLRSRTLCGGGKADYVRDWLSTLEGSHFVVSLRDPLFHLVAWVADETTPLPDTTELARDWFGVRAPSLAQVRLTQAVIDGFLSGHRSWSLWEHVGKHTRQLTDHSTLEVWRVELSKRFPAIQAFHDYLRAAFYKEVNSREGAYRQFDAQGYRSYIERNMQRLSSRLSGIVALATAELFPTKLVARFTDWVLCEGAKPKSVPTAEKLERKLREAFPGSRFQISIEEVA
jgi:hypothetical protein